VRAAFLPGDRTVELRDVPDPEPGRGQALLAVRASTICGSDLRAIYREHLGSGPEAYQDVVAGHEPSGVVVATGPGCQWAAAGSRVVVYHISGCGQCDECRRGYQIGCTSELRQAYGWQRDGGHAELLLAEERDLLPLPDSLSYLDGACVACGFGTAYEALRRVDTSGRDTFLVTGLGPVGLAGGMLAKALGSPYVVGSEPSADRRDLALSLGVVDAVVDASAGDADENLRDLLGDGAHVSLDASGAGAAQLQALKHTRRWGRCVLVGEGGTLTADVSHDLIHRQITLVGSWVTSTVRMAELLESLERWELHPDQVVTDRFGLEDAAEAYRLADGGARGKVGITFEEEAS
jgi:threonine dehydrogenase-like Zn-dependent dehydrogenase